MFFKIVMPAVEKTTTRGKIVRWFKKEGDAVSYGEPLFEAEMTYHRLSEQRYRVNVVSSDVGVLQRILAPDGTELAVGEAIAVVGSDPSALAPEAVDGALEFRAVANVLEE